MLNRRNLPKVVLIAVILAVLIAFPTKVPTYYLGLLTLSLIYAIFAVSLDILMGFTGLPSLGHAAMFGSAAFTVGILQTKVLEGSNMGVELVAGLGVAAGIAAGIGLLVTRTKGIHFLMLTLALSMVLWAIAYQWGSLTGGDNGLPGVSRPTLGFLSFSTTTSYYYLVLFCSTISIALMYLIVRSPYGLSLCGIRDNETRMLSMGFNVWLHKYIAFVIAGTFAGFAGVLLAWYNGFVHHSLLHASASVEAMLMVILGGQGTLFGPALGSFIIIFAKNIISAYTDQWLMALGAIYVLVVVFASKGVYTLIKQVIARWMTLLK